MRNKTWKTAAAKSFMAIAAIGLAIPGQFAFATPAAATTTPPGQYAVSFCRFFLSLGAFSRNDLGICIGAAAAQYNQFANGQGDLEGSAAVSCRFALDNYPDFFYSLYDSYAECVADDFGNE